jgi:hypothetical protein
LKCNFLIDLGYDAHCRQETDKETGHALIHVFLTALSDGDGEENPTSFHFLQTAHQWKKTHWRFLSELTPVMQSEDIGAQRQCRYINASI